MRTHGRNATYRNGCRCQACTRAIMNYQNARQPPPPEDPRHGRLSTYTNMHCRCPLCTAAKRAYGREKASVSMAGEELR